jgi:glycosyltransferase involved in cell wall biosynthesis
LLELANLFLTERPDVVHTHSSKAGILARLAAALAGVPVVVHTYHGFGFHDYLPSLVKGFYVLLERLCCRLTRAIVFVSKANEEYARRHRIGDPARYHLIRSGVRLAEFPAPVAERGKRKAQLGFGMHKPLVVSIGNLKPQKNPADFVAMAERVCAELPETEFVFVGDGPLRQRLEFQLVAKGLSGRVKLPGWRRDAAELLALADVFVMTSLWEGLPRALVEALKSGVPAVCYAADGVVDVLQDGVNGFVVAPRDVNALAEKVARLLRDEPLRKSMAAQAAASVGPEFDIDLMVRAQERLYDSLLGRD